MGCSIDEWQSLVEPEVRYKGQAAGLCGYWRLRGAGGSEGLVPGKSSSIISAPVVMRPQFAAGRRTSVGLVEGARRGGDLLGCDPLVASAGWQIEGGADQTYRRRCPPSKMQVSGSALEHLPAPASQRGTRKVGGHTSLVSPQAWPAASARRAWLSANRRGAPGLRPRRGEGAADRSVWSRRGRGGNSRRAMEAGRAGGRPGRRPGRRAPAQRRAFLVAEPTQQVSVMWRAMCRPGGGRLEPPQFHHSRGARRRWTARAWSRSQGLGRPAVPPCGRVAMERGRLRVTRSLARVPDARLSARCS